MKILILILVLISNLYGQIIVIPIQNEIKLSGELAVPQNLSAIARGGYNRIGFVDLSWTAVSDADGYQVYRGTDSNNVALVRTVTNNSYTDTMTTGIYFYRVRAYKGQEFSNFTFAKHDTVYEFEVHRYLSAITVDMHDSVKFKLNNFVKSVKDGTSSDSLSQLADIMYLFALPSNNHARLNLVKRSHDVIELNSPTFTAFEGYTGNGSSSNLNTNYTPSSQSVTYLRTSCSWGIYERITGTTGRMNFGGWANIGGKYPTNQVKATAPSSTLFYAIVDENGNDTWTNSTGTIGYVSANRDESNQMLYKNGVNVRNTTRNPSTEQYNRNIRVLCRDNNNSLGEYSTSQISFFYMGRNLSASEHQAIFNAVENYMDSNGKGVVP